MDYRETPCGIGLKSPLKYRSWAIWLWGVDPMGHRRSIGTYGGDDGDSGCRHASAAPELTSLQDLTAAGFPPRQQVDLIECRDGKRPPL